MPGGDVGEPDRGLDLVHVLPPGAPGAERVDLQVRLVDLDIDVVVDLGRNEHGCERRVAPLVGVERRDPDEPVDAGLRLEVSVRVVARQEEGGALDPRLVALLPLDELHGVPVPVGEPGVHPEEHLRPVLGLRPPGPGVDRHDRVQRVVLAGEHPLELDRVQRLVDGGDLLLDLGSQPLAARLSREGEVRPQVLQGRFEGGPAPEERPDRLPFPKDGLGRLGGVPETVALDHGRKLLETGPLRVYLKDSPGAPGTALQAPMFSLPSIRMPWEPRRGNISAKMVTILQEIPKISPVFA